MNMDTQTAPIEVAKLVEDTIFWFEQRIETLNDIADCEENVVLASTNGKESKLDDDQSRVFKAGIKTAISIIGKFPLSLDRSTKQFNVDDLEA